jgi:hypothetical protein
MVNIKHYYKRVYETLWLKIKMKNRYLTPLAQQAKTRITQAIQQKIERK